MTTSLLADAFAHNTWASRQILDACLSLSHDQLATNVPGTYGTVIDTLRHLVQADTWYLFILTDGAVPDIDESTMTVAELRAENERNVGRWTEYLAQDLDPDTWVVQSHDDGTKERSALGVRLAQVVHHGSDHRSQVATALTILGITPPDIDVWAWASTVGRDGPIPAEG